VEIKRELNINAAAYMLNSLNTMWPALIFAARRNDKVIGRTEILVVSISTRNGFNQSGAPSGRKWAINILGNLDNLDKIMDIHRGNPNTSVKIKWLEVLKAYGIRPTRLIIIRVVNSDLKILFNPFRWNENVRFNCLIIVSWNIIIVVEVRLGKVQNCIWNKMRINILKMMNKKFGSNELNIIGSNDEKMSDIMRAKYG
jgi:hypothetical protein